MNINALRNIYNAIEVKDMSFDAFVRGYAEAIKPISKGEVAQQVKRNAMRDRDISSGGIILPN